MLVPTILPNLNNISVKIEKIGKTNINNNIKPNKYKTGFKYLLLIKVDIYYYFQFF